MSRATTHRWLDLAARVRQWTLDEQGQVLQQARVIEDGSQRTHAAAAGSLKDAHTGRLGLLSRPQFRAAELLQQAGYETDLRERLAHAERTLQVASAEVDSIRTDMHHTLAQRDAYRHRAIRAVGDARQQESRAAVRELDELWLLRLHESDAGAKNED